MQIGRWVLIVALLTHVTSARAQAPTAETSLPAETPLDTPKKNVRQAELERYRGFIGNTDDSTATRIARAEELLLTGWPEAPSLVTEMLGASDDPSTKIVLCSAIANVGHKNRLLDETHLLAPLLALLGNADANVSRLAGDALAAFASRDTTVALSNLARDEEEPLKRRLAALDSLAQNTHRREVVEALVGLLGAKESPVVSKTIAALRRVARQDHGANPDAWRQWWQQQTKLDPQAWLTSQLTLRSEQLRLKEQAYDALLEESRKRYRHLASRFSLVLADLYRLAPAPNKEALIESWLSESTREYRMVAVSLVAEQISEGNLPSDALRKALRLRYNDDDPEVRRQAVEIVGALNDPAETGPMLARLDLERDHTVRETILRVLGKLRNPDVIKPLITEIERPDAPDGCVAAAADALAMLADRGGIDEAARDSIIGPLKARFARAAPAPRVALLGAMAAIGSPAFKTEFETNLTSEDPELLLRAIQGIAVVGNSEQLDRLSHLTAHPDARVRHHALTALGVLGKTEQLSTVVARLSPSVETVEGARQAAWGAFVQICSRLTVAEQVAASDRLADHPELAAEYLTKLDQRLSQTKPTPPELAIVRRRVAELYVALGRNAEALPYWRQLYASAVAATVGTSTNTGTGTNAGTDDGRTLYPIAMALLKCSLAVNNVEQSPELLKVLQPASSAQRQEAGAAMIALLEGWRTKDRVTDTAALAARLEPVSAAAYPELKSYLSLHFPPPTPAPTTTTAPTPTPNPAD